MKKNRNIFLQGLKVDENDKDKNYKIAKIISEGLKAELEDFEKDIYKEMENLSKDIQEK